MFSDKSRAKSRIQTKICEMACMCASFTVPRVPSIMVIGKMERIVRDSPTAWSKARLDRPLMNEMHERVRPSRRSWQALITAELVLPLDGKEWKPVGHWPSINRAFAFLFAVGRNADWYRPAIPVQKQPVKDIGTDQNVALVTSQGPSNDTGRIAPQLIGRA